MTRVKAIYRSWPFRVPASRFMHRAIVPSGSGRSANQECTGERNFIISNSTRCDACGSKCGGTCWRRARSTKLGNCLPDSVDRTDPGGGAAGHLADPAPVSHQAAAMDLWRCRHRDQQQRGSPCCERQLERKKKPVEIRGLNENCNHDLKNLLKGAAIVAATKPGPSPSSMRNCG